MYDELGCIVVSEKDEHLGMMCTEHFGKKCCMEGDIVEASGRFLRMSDMCSMSILRKVIVVGRDIVHEIVICYDDIHIHTGENTMMYNE